MRHSFSQLRNFALCLVGSTILPLVAPPVFAQQPRSTASIDVEEVMSAADFRGAGLQKLTAEEKAVLNGWLTRYFAALLGNAGKVGSVQSAADAVPTRGVIASQIEGTFNGWSGDTVFTLTNGQIWQQATYAYIYHHAYRPDVLIYPSRGGFEMRVDGVNEKIGMKRLK